MAAHSYEIGASIFLANFIANEIPGGYINSSNKNFTLAYTPIVGTVRLYLNGMLQKPGIGFDYIISGITLTFDKAPRTNSEIIAHYIRA
jgi:hypothetical protein